MSYFYLIENVSKDLKEQIESDTTSRSNILKHEFMNERTGDQAYYKKEKDNLFTNDYYIVKEDDTSGVPKNEPYLYLRSAYLDYRFNPPKIWILALAGKTISSSSIQCYRMQNINKDNIVKPLKTNIYLNHTKACFFKMYVFHCDMDQGKPDFVTISTNQRGLLNNSSCFIIRAIRFYFFKTKNNNFYVKPETAWYGTPSANKGNGNEFKEISLKLLPSIL